MHLHILGICGTFMGGIAAIAKAAGHRVTGSDRNVYPPMSTQLEALGIELTSGFDAAQLKPAPEFHQSANDQVPSMPPSTTEDSGDAQLVQFPTPPVV